jgi:hypothetical protein
MREEDAVREVFQRVYGRPSVALDLVFKALDLQDRNAVSGDATSQAIHQLMIL